MTCGFGKFPFSARVHQQSRVDEVMKEKNHHLFLRLDDICQNKDRSHNRELSYRNKTC